MKIILPSNRYAQTLIQHFLKKITICCGLALSATPSHAELLFASSFEQIESGVVLYPTTDAEAARFLTQATFGPSLSSITELRALGNGGYPAWINQQIRKPRSQYLAALDALINANGQLNNVGSYNFHNIWFDRVLYGQDQLRLRVAHALSQIFVVSQYSNLNAVELAGYYDMLSKNAFGNYRTLLEEVTLHPAMGHYLSMWRNRKPGLGKDNLDARSDLRDDARPDENYAREIMQLFSIGTEMLNLDGTVKDGNPGQAGIQPIPTYSQETIKGFAHVFTGWHDGSCKTPAEFKAWHWNWCPQIDDTPGGARAPRLVAKRYRLPMKPWGEGSPYADAFHAKAGTKQLLNYPGVSLPGGILPAGGSARGNMAKALDNIFYHPNVAPFISRLLIQRLTTSNPTPAYVKRVASVFENNGQGVRGDLAATVRAILLDPEARDKSQAPAHFGKVREPIMRVANLYRALDGKSRLGRFEEAWIGNKTQQMVLDAPTVFNYYLPDYRSPNARQMLAPELQMMTDSQVSTLNRFLEGKIYWGSYFGDLDPDQHEKVTQLSFNMFAPLLNQPQALVNKVDLLFTYGSMPQWFKNELLQTIARDKYNRYPDSDHYRRVRVANLIWLTMASPIYLVEGH